MACGLSVIGYRNDLEIALEQLTMLPERKHFIKWQNKHVLPNHDVKTVVNQLTEIYETVLGD